MGCAEQGKPSNVLERALKLKEQGAVSETWTRCPAAREFSETKEASVVSMRMISRKPLTVKMRKMQHTLPSDDFEEASDSESEKDAA